MVGWLVGKAEPTLFFLHQRRSLFLTSTSQPSTTPLPVDMDTMMSENGASRQVQVQFFTNSLDIELPEEERQLLVPTSKSYLPADSISLLLTLFRRWQIPVIPGFGFGVHARYVIGCALSILDQRDLSSNHIGGIPDRQRALCRNSRISGICTEFHSTNLSN